MEITAISGSDFDGIQQDMLSRHEISPIAVSSLVGVWYLKAKLRGDVAHEPLLIISGMVIHAAAQQPILDQDSARRLWTVFKYLLELEHGSKMDETREREGIAFLAYECARLDEELSKDSDARIRDRLLKGLTEGTSDADLFSQKYSEKMIQISIEKHKPE